MKNPPLDYHPTTKPQPLRHKLTKHFFSTVTLNVTFIEYMKSGTAASFADLLLVLLIYLRIDENTHISSALLLSDRAFFEIFLKH